MLLCAVYVPFKVIYKYHSCCTVHFVESIINQQCTHIKFHIKTFKIAPTCFDPKIILRELRCSLLKSF